MMTMTAKANDKAKELFKEKGLEGQAALRVFVVGGGCSGYQYGMALARQPDEDDFVIEHDGVRLVIDPDSAPLLEGAEIDYVDDLMKAGFTIFNPNAVKSCACGSSFQTPGGGGSASPRRREVAGRQPDDKLIFSLTKIMKFGGLAEVTSDYFEDHTKVFKSEKKPQEDYPFRVNVKPEIVLTPEQYLDVKAIAPRMGNTKKWPGGERGG